MTKQRRTWRTGNLLAAIMTATACAAVVRAERPARAEIRVGIGAGDIRGEDQRAMQSAIDLVADLGGGTVHVGPGRYVIR